MVIPLYLAMTAAETAANSFPENPAYMACHFSSYGCGLSNLPRYLPEGTLLILNDRIPLWGHDPQLVAQQLDSIVREFSCCGVLLDLQRPEDSSADAVVSTILDTLPCPVGVSEHYAKDRTCPVFLSCPPPDLPLANHIAPWDGREIWLEAATETIQIAVTQTGSIVTPLPLQEPAEPNHVDENTCCRYHVQVLSDQALFTLSRTEKELALLLAQATRYHITKAVGLYQQLKNFQHKKEDPQI